MGIFTKTRTSGGNPQPKEINLDAFQPGDMVIFFDRDTKEPPDKSGCNQIGIILKGNNLLFRREKKVFEKDINELNMSTATVLPVKNPELASRIYNYFELNKKNHHLFTLGLRVLKDRQEGFFTSPVIMPTHSSWNSDEDYEEGWQRLISRLQPGDHIFTFNEKSLISRLIACLDRGSWSHVGIYVGEGQIIEAVGCGLVKREIEVSRNKYVHLGIYRFFDTTAKQRDGMIREAHRFIGRGYSYRKAIRLGLRILLRMKLDPSKPGDCTPNGLIYFGMMYLVDYI